MSNIIRTHPKDSLVAVSQTATDFVSQFVRAPVLHGTILDRQNAEQYADLHQSYSDLFNNLNNSRTIIEDFIKKNSQNKENIIYARAKLGGDIKYFNIKLEDITSEMNNILSLNTHLKSDIEFGIRTLSKRYKGNITIWMLSDYPNVKSTSSPEMARPHIDPHDTFYIQCGGVGLQLSSENLSGKNLGNDRRYNRMIMNEIDPASIYELNKFDLVLMRGNKNPDLIQRIINSITHNDHLNNNPFAHFRDDTKIFETGRFAFSLFKDT